MGLLFESAVPAYSHQWVWVLQVPTGPSQESSAHRAVQGPPHDTKPSDIWQLYSATSYPCSTLQLLAAETQGQTEGGQHPACEYAKETFSKNHR